MSRVSLGQPSTLQMNKFLILLLLLTLSRFAVARMVEHELELLAENRKSDAEHLEKATVDERDLHARLDHLPPDSPEAKPLQAQLAETREVIDVLIKRRSEAQAERSRLLATPEYRISQAVKHDKRQPTRRDLSGIWFSPLNLVGYTLQLNQHGRRITGQGYYGGCMGIYDTFTIKGLYTPEALSLTLYVSSGKTERRVFHYHPWKHHLAFQGHGKAPYNTLIPASAFH